MGVSSPTIEYNADNETFNIQYANCEPFRMKVPLADAPFFKKAMTDRTKTPQKARIIRKPNGRFYIKELQFGDKGKDSKQLTSVVNLTVEDTEAHYKATVARVLAELKKIYSKGQVWK